VSDRNHPTWSAYKFILVVEYEQWVFDRIRRIFPPITDGMPLSYPAINMFYLRPVYNDLLPKNGKCKYQSTNKKDPPKTHDERYEFDFQTMNASYFTFISLTINP
ncbi:MAG: hypothetical protein RLZZ519_3304, partial [Bacteroidota bacterium]